MNKIWLIIKREYITRVRNKTFLLSTFLLPIAMILFFAGTIFFAVKSADGKKKYAVKDPSGFLEKYLKGDSSKLQYEFTLKADTGNYHKLGYDGLLYDTDTDASHLFLKTPKAASPMIMERLKKDLQDAFTSSQLMERNISQKELDSINNASTKFFALNNLDETNKQVDSKLNTGIGYVCGILIYIVMLIFGTMVMRGVMEEKTNRIAEVVVSSVKPFQLMMGKILGIGAVGLTQMILWVIFVFALSASASLFIPHNIMEQAQHLQSNPAGMAANPEQYSEAAKTIANFQSINWALIIPSFLFYFIGGFLFYAALFAAVGSVVNEDPQEAQSLTLPIMMPIIFGFMIMSTNINTPDSSAMVWGSIIPFTSPIVMMARLSTSPPLWQLGLSALFLIGGFLCTTWLAGKIYRTGILMYGKKPSWKEMMKWAFKK